ncbi:hypothetical protein CSHISOI_05531 [Colletotrichum shisoi]|uniref:Uncharacterized protein n=1 Tax=Colletotrichum shisoi TaxID=2078593 RepID=A0A5Q4BSH1_9PEZI|nr:hypothetical protein CSHISOI_05531 [Colletotrichum shisoi]
MTRIETEGCHLVSCSFACLCQANPRRCPARVCPWPWVAAAARRQMAQLPESNPTSCVPAGPDKYHCPAWRRVPGPLRLARAQRTFTTIFSGIA